MNRTIKGIAIAAAGMVTAGILLSGIGFMAGGMRPVYFDNNGIHVGDGKKGGGRLENFSQDTEGFSSINVDLDYCDVDLIPSDKFAVDGTYFSKEGKPEISIKGGTLTVKDAKNEMIKVSLDIPGLLSDKDDYPAVRIYYPEDTKFKDITIKCDASDLSFEKLRAEKIEFELDLGKLNLTDIAAKSINVSMDSGACTLEGIKADDLALSNDMGKTTLKDADLKSLKIDANSGEVSLSRVSANTGELYSDMGKVSGTDMSTNGLKVNSNSGEVNLQGKLFGLTDITCDMGAVIVDPGAPRDQFNYELNADMGSVSLGGDSVTGSVVSNSVQTSNTLKIKTDMGDIKVNFQ